jgi:hypothetical protein
MLQNRLATGLVVLSLVLLSVILLYMFGTPTSGSAESAVPASASSPQAPTTPTEPESSEAPPAGEVVEGEVPPPDPSSPLAIEIPGCTCHSDDPEIVAEHEQYRMNQCAGCHMGGMPMGGG